MLKKILIGLAAAAVVVVGTWYALLAYTKSHSPFESVEFNKNGLVLKIGYCRPYKKGRVIFADDGLVPFGQVWRTGANEATTFETNRSIRIGGEPLAPGKYALFTIPRADTWTIMLNSEWDQWGAFNRKPELDVLRVDAPVEKLDHELEQFTIELTGSNGIQLHFKWDTTHVAVPIELAGEGERKSDGKPATL